MDLYEWFLRRKKYENITIQEVAKALGSDPGRLSEIMRGKRAPSHVLCKKVEKFTNGEVKPLDMMKFYYESQDRN